MAYLALKYFAGATRGQNWSIIFDSAGDIKLVPRASTPPPPIIWSNGLAFAFFYKTYYVL
ncbi:hypothetical protein N7540_003181 [Penicillium herquei]|nr:hypothetical protein N7540_003181 [Penicillium herquei]